MCEYCMCVVLFGILWSFGGPFFSLRNITTLVKCYLVFVLVQNNSNEKIFRTAVIFVSSCHSILYWINTLHLLFDCTTPYKSFDFVTHVEKVHVGWLNNKWDLIIIVCCYSWDSNIHNQPARHQLFKTLPSTSSCFFQVSW